jgi:hypothetical protein
MGFRENCERSDMAELMVTSLFAMETGSKKSWFFPD